MELTRIKELMVEADNERLDLMEITEIEDAYALIPDEKLRDFRDNATIIDMLIDLEDLA